MVAEVQVTMREGGFQIEAAVEAVEEALDVVGSIIASSAQRAFTDQRLGDVSWSERYPGQPAPFINVAGAVSDLSRSSRVKGRRFERRPAGIDSNTLARSISHAVVSSDTVEVGSDVEYAPRFQLGGVATQPVTATTRKNLATFLRSSKGRPFRAKLGFLFHVEQLETTVAARPFLGITEMDRRDIIDVIEDQIERESRRGES